MLVQLWLWTMLNPPVNQRVSFSVRPDGTQDFTIAFNKEKTAEMKVRLNVGMMCTSCIHHKQQLQQILHRHISRFLLLACYPTQRPGQHRKQLSRTAFTAFSHAVSRCVGEHCLFLSLVEWVQWYCAEFFTLFSLINFRNVLLTKPED